MPEIVFKGKEYVYNHHLSVPYRPLVADAAKGVGAPDLSGNLVIHGDNLHALKSLLPRYAGAVDLIFIDPPYNTGNEGWCYSDGVNSPIMKEWLSTNPVDGEDMLRHDKWLCMMWPRLTLLRDLLSERGLLAVFIGNDEQHRLRCALDEVFGAERFVTTLAWRSRAKPSNTGDAQVKPQQDCEYVHIYGSTDGSRFNKVVSGEARKYPHQLGTRRYRLQTILKSNRGENERPESMRGEVNGFKPPEGQRWQAKTESIQALFDSGHAELRDGTPFRRYFEDEEPGEHLPFYTYVDRADSGTAEGGKNTLNEVLGTDHGFDTVKPLEILQYLIDHCASPDSLILDSFAGSGTTAHAVLKANAKDGGTRRFILVEGEDYADRLTAERVRRAINGYAWAGTQRETLLEEKITLTQFKKANEWLAKVDAIKRAEGLADGDDGAQASLDATAPVKRKRFDKIEVKIDDGVLRVEGVRRISEMAPGLGGSFTYCTLGDAVELEKLLSGERLPEREALGAWLFYTATGATLPPVPQDAPPHYLGEALDRHVWLVYEPQLAFLKSPAAALTLSLAEHMRRWGRERDVARGHAPKGHLVFAPAKYLSNQQLKAHGVDYAPLPFALYRES
jgi:adenine-specific DNA-methyltransferase